MSKEPGQLAAETYLTAWASIDTWETLRQSQKTAWACVEAAVRADERAGGWSPVLQQIGHDCAGTITISLDESGVRANATRDLVQSAVETMNATALPQSFVVGWRGVVGEDAKGSLAGRAGQIAVLGREGLRFMKPSAGCLAWSMADRASFVFDGSQWVEIEKARGSG
jgi:hypothetical protein